MPKLTTKYGSGKIDGDLIEPMLVVDQDEEDEIQSDGGSSGKWASKNKRTSREKYETKKKWRTCSDTLIAIVASVFSVLAGSDTVLTALLVSVGAQVFADYAEAIRAGDNITPEMLAVAQEALQNDVKLLLVMYVSAMVFLFTSSYVQVVLWQVLAERRIRHESKQCMRLLLRQSIAWWDEHHSGQINQDVERLLNQMRQGLGEKIGLLIQMITWVLTSLILIAVVKWWMLLLAMGIVATTYGGATVLRHCLGKNQRKAKEEHQGTTHIATETFDNMRTVHAYNAQQYETDRFEKLQSSLTRLSLKTDMFTALLSSWMSFMSYANVSILLWLCFTMIMNDELTLGGFFLLTLCSTRLTLGCETLVSLYFEVTASFKSIKELKQFSQNLKSSKETVLDSKHSTVPFDQSKPIKLQMQNVSFYYPSRPTELVLNDFNLLLTENKFVAVVGQTGSGKSTVANLLLSLYDGYEGKIQINNAHELRELNARAWRSAIGVVGQSSIVFDMSVVDNIRCGRPNITRAQIISACKIANADEIIRDLPLSYETILTGSQLSGGQLQRLALARALAGNPKLLILDEPTASLDTQNERIVQRAIEQAVKGRAAIMISHRLSLVESCDEIIVLDGGEVVERGSYDDLIEERAQFYEMVMKEQNPSSSSSLAGSIEDLHIADPKQVIAKPFLPQISSTGNKSVTMTEPGEYLAEKIDFSNQLHLPKWHVAVCCLMSIAQAWTQPFRGFLMYLSLEAIVDKDESVVGTLCIYFATGGLLTAIITFSMMYSFMYVSQWLAYAVRVTTFSHTLNLRIPTLDLPAYSASNLLKILFDHPENVKNGVGWRLGNTVASVFAVTAASIIVTAMNWRLFLLALAGIPILAGGHFFAWIAKKRTNVNTEANKLRYEALQKIRAIRSLNMEDEFERKFHEVMNDSSSSLRRTCTVDGLACSYSKICQTLFGVVVVLYGYMLIMRGDVDPLKVVGARLVITFATMAMGISVYYIKSSTVASNSWKTLTEFLHIDADAVAERHTGIQSKIDGTVRFESVSFQYSHLERTNLVLKNVSFQTPSGKLTVIVGRSGSGKSTILQLIQRFYEPNLGQIMSSHLPVNLYNMHHLRQQVAWLPQNPVLFDATVFENIRYGVTDCDRDRLVECAKMADAHEFIVKLPLGYETNVGQRGQRFSGGQRQRIALARALLRNPQLLLLDEATSALDVQTEQKILSTLQQCAFSIVMVTHRLAAAEIADLVLVMKRGKLVQHGTYTQLAQSEGYFRQLVENTAEAVMSDTNN